MTKVDVLLTVCICLLAGVCFADIVRPLYVRIITPQEPLKVGEEVELLCETSVTRPPSKISWWMDDVEIQSETESLPEIMNVATNKLKIRPTIDDDGKTMICKVEDTVPEHPPVQDTWTMNVFFPPEVSLHLGRPIRDFHIKQGSDVYMECIIRANPPIFDLTWLFENQQLFNNHSAGVIISNQTLVLQKLKMEHRGRYKCIASNYEGEGESDLFLDVLYAVVEPPPPSRELNVDKLDYYVNTEAGKAILFSEFLGIKSGKRRPWTEAERPENLPKNRYDDLLPYDETRVVLKPRSYDDSDFINANYIDGYHRQKEYVATQGPLPNTTNDFWAMIWQLNIKKIVMLANLFEHGKPKVAKYWPDDTQAYGDIIVKKLSEHSMPEIQHVVRIFSLEKSGVVGFRIVRHFHYTGWPDLGVPTDRLSVLGLLQQVRKYHPESTDPICIHCSAGVGRTGTVILMDSMMERAKQEGVVNFPERLDHMRVQRVDVVEKKEQYVFAHQGVNDLFQNSTETVEYLEKVDQMHKSLRNELYKKEFQRPLSMDEALERIRWHSHRITAVLEAIDKGFPDAA